MFPSPLPFFGVQIGLLEEAGKAHQDESGL